MKTVIKAILILCFCGTALFAQDKFPEKDFTDLPDPIASPHAVAGGKMSVFAGQNPKSLNYYLDNNVVSAQVFGYMFETLLTLNPLTVEFEPGLAEKWTISEDRKTYTFYLDKKAKWSNGKPVTAHDVKWTFNAILDPDHLTGVHKVSLERFEAPQIIDDYTIRFTAKTVHWKNLLSISTFEIMSREAYKDRDFNKINFEFPVVSGPYRLGELKEGIFLDLNRRDDWWGWRRKRNQGTGNFKTLKIRFFAEQENAFESFKKQILDLYPVYMSRIWVNESRGEKFVNNWIVKQKIYNHNPVGFQGFAMNMRKAPFDDVKVRKAMAYALDREKMNRTLMYNQYFLHRSYYEDLYSEKNPCPNPLIKMDKNKARSLLKEAGWKVNPKTGILEKNNKPFEFKFLTRSASSEKFLAIYAEDLKDIGIRMIIDKKDWAAWLKDMDQFNFHMTWAAWGSSLFKDPEGMWASKEAKRKGGNNVTGFQNKRVDELIELQKTIFDITRRNEIVREIDQIVFNEFPYVLLWNIDYTRLLYWNQFGMPETVLSKYGDERSAYSYWWSDPDLHAELEFAMKNDIPLPAKDLSVHWDRVFEPAKTIPVK